MFVRHIKKFNSTAEMQAAIASGWLVAPYIAFESSSNVMNMTIPAEREPAEIEYNQEEGDNTYINYNIDSARWLEPYVETPYLSSQITFEVNLSGEVPAGHNEAQFGVVPEFNWNERVNDLENDYGREVTDEEVVESFLNPASERYDQTFLADLIDIRALPPSGSWGCVSRTAWNIPYADVMEEGFEPYRTYYIIAGFYPNNDFDSTYSYILDVADMPNYMINDNDLEYIVPDPFAECDGIDYENREFSIWSGMTQNTVADYGHYGVGVFLRSVFDAFYDEGEYGRDQNDNYEDYDTALADFKDDGHMLEYEFEVDASSGFYNKYEEGISFFDLEGFDITSDDTLVFVVWFINANGDIFDGPYETTECSYDASEFPAIPDSSDSSASISGYSHISDWEDQYGNIHSTTCPNLELYNEDASMNFFQVGCFLASDIDTSTGIPDGYNNIEDFYYDAAWLHVDLGPVLDGSTHGTLVPGAEGLTVDEYDISEYGYSWIFVGRFANATQSWDENTGDETFTVYDAKPWIILDTYPDSSAGDDSSTDVSTGYIFTTGQYNNGYFNTGYVPGPDTVIQLKGNFIADGNVTHGIKGAQGDWIYRMFGYGSHVYYDRIDDTVRLLAEVHGLENSMHEYEFGNFYIKVDGVTVDQSSEDLSQFSTDLPLLIFAGFAPGAEEGEVVAEISSPGTKLEYFKILEPDGEGGLELMADYRPVLDGNDDICLYDTVSGETLYADGSNVDIECNEIVAEPQVVFDSYSDDGEGTITFDAWLNDDAIAAGAAYYKVGLTYDSALNEAYEEARENGDDEDEAVYNCEAGFLDGHYTGTDSSVDSITLYYDTSVDDSGSIIVAMYDSEDNIIQTMDGNDWIDIENWSHIIPLESYPCPTCGEDMPDPEGPCPNCGWPEDQSGEEEPEE